MVNTLAICSLGIKFEFREMLLGGAALDEIGVPLPEETLSVAKQSDAILLGAIGGYLSSQYLILKRKEKLKCTFYPLIYLNFNNTC